MGDYNATCAAVTLGLSGGNYNFLMGLSGVISGFAFMFTMLFILFMVGKK
jgi:hypothetical protein